MEGGETGWDVLLYESRTYFQKKKAHTKKRRMFLLFLILRRRFSPPSWNSPQEMR